MNKIEVQTPTWNLNENSIHEIKHFFGQEKIEKHKLAELFESRINDGKDTEHHHPALAANLLENSKIIKKSKEEIDRYNNYNLIKPNYKIPLFWEKRIWDQSNNNFYNELETLEIEKKNNNFFFQLIDLNSQQNLIYLKKKLFCPKPSNPKNNLNKIPIILSVMEFDTDGTDTDLEII